MKKIKVAIRAGHGGSDRANRGPTGYIEADGNLQFALDLEEELKTDPRFEVYNIRKTDVYIPLEQGPILAAEWKADVYLAFHSDAYSTRSRGVTVFESVDLDNEFLAELIGKGISEAMGIPFRGVKSKESKKFPGEDYYTDVDMAQDLGIPFVGLVERGYHSNPFEEAKLKDGAVVRLSAKNTRKALQSFFFPEDEHWANEYYDSLNNKGIKVNEKRFDDYIKRGEVMAIVDRATDRKDDKTNKL